MRSSYLRTMLRAAGGLATAAGVLLGVLEYRSQGRAERAAETLDMIAYWETEGARDAYAALTAGLIDQLSRLSAVESKALAGDDRNARRQMVETIAARVIRQPTNEANFETVIYFFTRLGLCIEADLCDQHSAEVFFSDTLETFVANFQGQIDARRDPSSPQYRAQTYGDAVFDLNRRLSGVAH